jgi:hypothetical protein
MRAHVLSRMNGVCVAVGERKLGANREWTQIVYAIDGADSAQQAVDLLRGSCILHSVADPAARNRFELCADELGPGKIVWAGLQRASAVA